jgi:hypothetical protein
MRSNLSTPAETPPAMSPDADLRGKANAGRWRNAPGPEDQVVSENAALQPAATDDPLDLVAPEGATWRLAEWLRMPRVLRRRLSPWLMSVIIHAAAIIALGLWITRSEVPSVQSELKLTAVEGSSSGGEELQADAGLSPSSFSAIIDSASASIGEAPMKPLDVKLEAPVENLSSRTTSSVQPITLENLSSSGQQSTNWGAVISKGGGLNGRSPGSRAKLAADGGGSRLSEEAVERGLKWLIAHQHDDGSWRFHFDGLPCGNACRNPGTESTSTGSTALALLPFYGAGYTHHQGPYAEQVSKGLYYLCNRMLVVPQGGDLQEGTMYAQGLATIVLCEAYAMSKDENLRPYAERAVKFVLYAQDGRGGGWRYTPGMPGDTTMTGWQLMALKSARLAGLEVPSSRFFLAGKFLDSVQSERGAAYGYRTTIKRPSTSAVGLLCRMYLGWGRTHPAVREGVLFFDRLGPSPTDMYMNYYATQLMYHHGSAPWDRWNKKMRDYLIQTQATQGHENGSWHFDDQHGNAGGRLYSTAMSILILEVYYRYLPLFSTRAVDEGF